MWQRYKLYLLAFVIYTIGTVVLVALEVLAEILGDSALLARLVTMLSGSFLGGFALVLGILKDDRYEKEKQRAEKAETDNAVLQKRLAASEKLAAQAGHKVEQAEQARDRAEAELQRVRADAEQARQHAESELQRVRAEHSRETAERLRRLEAAVGIVPIGAIGDSSDDRLMEQ